MLYLSAVIIEGKDIETFDELLKVVKKKAKNGEVFIRLDLKPP